MKPKFLNNEHEFWDQTLIKDLLEEVDGERQIVVVPGTINDVDEVSMELEQYPKVLVIITSDEENRFPIDELFHPNMIIYATYYNPKYKTVDHWLPIGYSKKSNLPLEDKVIPWFFAGQVTHKSRFECVQILRNMKDGLLVETDGFAKGLPKEEYLQHMATTKVAPAPMGNISPDSFRLYEALETGAVPIPENREFWINLFEEEPPFPILEDYVDLEGYIMDAIYRYPGLNNRCQAWWQRKKRGYIYQLRRDCA